ncbi:MAG TPA: hypothetical protein VGL81_02935, partial [Polyangiaceae bacterium]
MATRRAALAGPALLLCACAFAACSSHGSDKGDGGPNVLAGPPGTLTAWTATVGRKVQPTTATGTGSSITVETYRDAYAGAQLVVTGTGGHLQGVTASVDADLSDGQGHTLTTDNIALFREYFVDFSSVASDVITGNMPAPASSPTNDASVPDPLIPLVDPYTGSNAGQPFDVAEGLNQPLFVDVHVPKGLTAGVYTGTVHIAADVGGTADVPISVTVWALDLPDMRSVTTHFKMSVDDLTNYHAGVSTCSGGSCYLDTTLPATQTLLQRYEDLAHAHRIDVGQALVDAPVNGCTPPADSDWAAYDTAMTPYMTGSYFSDGVPSSRFDVPFSPGQTFGIDGTCSQSQYTALASAWATHLTSKGWFPKPSGGGFGAVAYAYDEPLSASSDASAVETILNQIVQDSTWLQAGASGSPSPWKAQVIDTVSPIAAPFSPATTPLLDPALGVYVVDLEDYGAGWQPYYGRQQWQETPGLFGEGLELWFYESNSVVPPYPTFASNTLDALEPVIMMWGSWFEQATGFLYWDIAEWDAMTPWGVETTYGKTGDGVLIYPGNHAGSLAPAGSPSDVAIDGPVPSYRLKMIRQGLQDWALFRYADSQGLTSFVQQQVA